MSQYTFLWVIALNLCLVVLLGTGQVQASFWQEEAKTEVQEEAAVEAAVVQDDDVVVEAEAMVMGNFGFDSKKMLAAKRFQLTQVFQVEIELIQRLCDPTPQQNAKLRVAAKGAVKKLTDEWWKKTGQQFGGGIRPANQEGDQGADNADQEADAANTQDVEDPAAAEIKDVDEIDSTMAQFIIMDRTGNPFKTKSPRQEAAWTNLVASILTAEQSKTLAEFKTAQEKQRRADMLDSIISVATRELALTTEQQTKLSEILQPHIENARLNSIPFFEPYLSYYYASKATNEELASVLSPAQIQTLRIFLLPAREIGAMMEMGDD